MKTILYIVLLIAFSIELHSENHTVIFVNSAGEESIVHLAADFGSQFKNYTALPGVKVLNGDSCILASKYRGDYVLIYVEFPRSKTDIQNFDDDRELYKLTLAKKRMLSNPENYNGPNFKYFIRYNIDPFIDTLVIEINEVTNCLGICRNGEGIKKGYKNVYNGTFDNQGIPNGKGIFEINDTIWDGTWNHGIPNGNFKITTGDYMEKGQYKNGVREGKFIFKIGNHTILKQFFVNGELHGRFSEQVRTDEGIQKTNGYYNQGVPEYERDSKNLNKPHQR